MPLPIYPTDPPSFVRNIIAIAAGKGGVGKSTLTAQLAHALRRLGLKIGVFDSDLYGPSLHTMLPEDSPARQSGSQLIPAISQGISILSLGHFRRNSDAVAVRAPIANNIISHFLQNAAWGELDMLLIDFPPGTGDIQLTLAQKAQLTGAIAITTPQKIALQDVRKAIHLFDQMCIPVVGIVENMSYYIPSPGANQVYPFGRGGGERLAQAVGCSLLGQIPMDPQICLCADAGRSLWDDPSWAVSEAAHAFESIAQNLLAAIERAVTPLSPTLKSLFRAEKGLLSLTWSDGLCQEIPLVELQRHCPCAQCLCAPGGAPMEGDVAALEITAIGRYAIKIHFSSGCSAGIYHWELLRQFACVR